MNPIPIQKKIEDLLKKLDHQNPEFESLVYYHEYKEAIWADKSCHSEEKRAFCRAVLWSALKTDDKILEYEFEHIKTCSIHWTEGIIVLSGNFDSKMILQQTVADLKITA